MVAKKLPRLAIVGQIDWSTQPGGGFAYCWWCQTRRLRFAPSVQVCKSHQEEEKTKIRTACVPAKGKGDRIRGGRIERQQQRHKGGKMKRMGGIRGSRASRRETEKEKNPQRCERTTARNRIGWIVGGGWGMTRAGSPERHLGRHQSNYPREYTALHHTRCK